MNAATYSRPQTAPKQPDWRVGRTYWDVLTDLARGWFSDGEAYVARRTLVSAISYSPRRRQYQLALRGPERRLSATVHVPARHIREVPE